MPDKEKGDAPLHLIRDAFRKLCKSDTIDDKVDSLEEVIRVAEAEKKRLRTGDEADAERDAKRRRVQDDAVLFLLVTLKIAGQKKADGIVK